MTFNIAVFYSPGAVLWFYFTIGIQNIDRPISDFTDIIIVKMKDQFYLHAYWFHSTVRPSSCPIARFTPLWTRICFRAWCSSVVGVEDSFYLICCFHDFVGLNHKTPLAYLQRAESQHLYPLVITQLLHLSYFNCLLCTFPSSAMSIRCAHEKHPCI